MFQWRLGDALFILATNNAELQNRAYGEFSVNDSKKDQTHSYKVEE